MAATIVDALHKDFSEIISYLKDNNEPSMQSIADENLKKALLLSAASYFERIVCESILRLVETYSENNVLLREFIANKALKRQYHTLFSWGDRNANSFYSLFGDGFKKYISTSISKNDDLEKGVAAFLEIGRERNRMVHNDFGTFTLEKTAEEIFALFQNALVFSEALNEHFDNYISTLMPVNNETGSENS